MLQPHRLRLALLYHVVSLQPGDLVFFNTRGARNSHVGVYLGNNEFVHAPRTGTVVRVEKISAYWDKRWNGARP